MIEFFGGLLIAAAGICFVVLFIKESRIRFVSIFAMIILLELKSEHRTFLLLDYAAAALFTGSFLFILLKKKIIQNIPFTSSPLFTYFAIFLLWGSLMGAISVAEGVVSLEQWYREILLFICPLFLLPIFYFEMLQEGLSSEKVLTWCIMMMWIVSFVGAIMKINSNLVQAAYLYEIGQARQDSINGPFMMYIFSSLAMIYSGTKRWLLTGAFLISVGSLLLTFGRTAWIAGFIFLPVVLLLGNRSEKKRGVEFVFMVLFTGVTLFIVAYLMFPMVRIGALYMLSKLTSSTNLRTDASMFNRYIEWSHVLKAIVTAPLTGFGFGGTFWNYDWLLGISKQSAYTHNGALSILFKSGIVGLILLFTTWIGYFVEGVRFVRNKFLTAKERAYVRAGIATMLHLVIIGSTGNIFYQREIMMYIALYWCYCIEIEQRIEWRKNVPELVAR